MRGFPGDSGRCAPPGDLGPRRPPLREKVMSVPLTPAMQQYVEIKSRYRDCILFFRMGDFYEMFFEDALRASRLLDIALTSRDKESNIPMCGEPPHARNDTLSTLIRQGGKVAICEQLEEPGC